MVNGKKNSDIKNGNEQLKQEHLNFYSSINNEKCNSDIWNISKGYKEKRKRSNGRYMMVYAPYHSKAIKGKSGLTGYVYEHVLIAEKMIGRSLRDDEHVHHLNDCPLDNRCENLLVLEKGQHTKIHNFIRRHNLEELFEKTKSDEYIVRECCYCGEYLIKDTKFCDKDCKENFNQMKKKNRPSLEQLQNLLNQGYNKVEIGKIYYVHRSTINNWINEYREIKNE